MAMSYFRGWIIMAATALIRAPEVAVAFVERTAVTLFHLIAPAFKSTRDLRVAYDGPTIVLDRSPLDPSLVQSMRHEAGVHQRGAVRGI